MSMSANRFHNILVATDFSEDAAAAFETAVTVARQFEAKLTVAHVVRDVPGAFAAFDYGTGWQITPDELERLQNELRADAQQRIQALVAKHRQSGIEIASETLIGLPYLAIMEAVKQKGFDLVFVGTRGMSAIKRIVVGSTATRLARACPAPVWVARQALEAAPSSILVPLDFSPISEHLVRVAASLALALGGKLHLLHVYDVDELYGVPPLSDDTRDELSRYRRYARRAALEKLERLLEAAGIDHGTTTLHVAQGIPWQVINSTARRLGTGLTIMGSVGRRGLSGLLIGNTAEKVLHTSDRSLLVVKPVAIAERSKVAEADADIDDMEIAAPVLAG